MTKSNPSVGSMWIRSARWSLPRKSDSFPATNSRLTRRRSSPSVSAGAESLQATQKSIVYCDIEKEILPPGIEYYLPLF